MNFQSDEQAAAIMQYLCHFINSLHFSLLFAQTHKWSTNHSSFQKNCFKINTALPAVRTLDGKLELSIYSKLMDR